MPILPKCCFCAKLETGGYIIGVLGVIFGTLFIISSIEIVSKTDEGQDKEITTFSKFWNKFIFK